MSLISYSNLKNIVLLHFVILIIFPYSILARGGSWQLLLNNVGISAMHMQLLNNDRVIMYDRTSFGRSNLTLPSSDCHLHKASDCTAHSAEYNILNNSIRPLNILTDTWCSSGAVFPDGRLVQTGGYRGGERVVRVFWTNNCSSSECDWVENPNVLLEKRWYATNNVLPDGSAIIIGGTTAFSYEFFPKTTSTSKLLPFPFLKETNDHGIENNLYPFVFLNVDGNLFVFANNRAILFNYSTNVVVRTYPTVPGGDPRNYPSTGSAVLLPLTNLDSGNEIEAEVLICGGAPKGAYYKARRGQFLTALDSCAKIKIMDPNAAWVMETMPTPRVMGDMVVLPNGDVVIINGAKSGIAGWELGRDPILTPIIYHPDNVNGSRFEVCHPTTIPRMYHSCAILLRDGRLLIGGSNPHEFDNYTTTLFPTDYRLEAFSPPYLDPKLSSLRPNITFPGSSTNITYGVTLKINFAIRGSVTSGSIKVTMVRPSFNTHSFSMNQRLLVLTSTSPVTRPTQGGLQLEVKSPGSVNIAPPGYYMLFVVHRNVPSEGIWVNIS